MFFRFRVDISTYQFYWSFFKLFRFNNDQRKIVKISTRNQKNNDSCPDRTWKYPFWKITRSQFSTWKSRYNIISLLTNTITIVKKQRYIHKKIKAYTILYASIQWSFKNKRVRMWYFVKWFTITLNFGLAVPWKIRFDES